MKSLQLIKGLAVLSFNLFVITSIANAQSALLICYNPQSKTFTAEASCASPKVKLTSSVLSGAVSKGVNYSSCYTSSGQTSGAPFDGVLTLALSCSKATDVMVSDTFTPTSNNRAYPALGSRTVLNSASGKFPNGLQISGQATPNSFYTVKASIVCCPQ